MSSASPTIYEFTLPHINFVSIVVDGKPPVYWIIDTGATHHTTPYITNFVSYSHVSPIHMKLPYGFTVMTNIADTVHLSTSIILTKFITFQPLMLI